jgi:hypothetical protein
MEERFIERKLTEKVREVGGLCFKFTSPGVVGVPDRLVLLSKGKIAFVEVKKPGEELRPIQAKRKKQIEALGFKVYVLDGLEKIGGIIDDIRTT